MAANIDCKKTFNSNVANITSNYDKRVIDITTAKILYQREIENLSRCSGTAMSSDAVNPYEGKVINYKFVHDLTIKQGLIKTYFKVGDIVKGEALPDGNIQVTVNGQIIGVSKDFVVETSENVTKITSETESEIKNMNPMYSNLEKIAIGFLILFVFLIFIKLLKVI